VSRSHCVVVLVVVAVLAASLAGGVVSASTSPKVACFDVSGKQRVGYLTRPKTCGLVPKFGVYGNRLIGGRWSSWGATTARGRGASYRLWSDITVQLFAPKNVCKTRLFTRVKVHYVGGGDEYWPDKTYTLKTC
jgi:hypothetical protein